MSSLELDAPRRDAALAPRPRRRVLAAIGATYLTRLAVAALASAPFVARVSASGIDRFDTGDGKLFEPGGLYLLEVLLHERDGLLALVAPTAVLLVAGSLAGVVPEWLLLRALAGERHGLGLRGRPEERSARRALPRLVLLALASWVARAILVLGAAALAMTVRSYFVSARDERLPLLGSGVGVLLGLTGWVALSLWRDLTAIEITLGGAAPLDALERALGVLRQRWLGLLGRYSGWWLAGLAALLAGAAAASAFDVSGGGSAAPLAAGLLHQLAIVAQIALHARWLASAIAAAAPLDEPPAPLDEPPAPAQADAFL